MRKSKNYQLTNEELEMSQSNSGGRKNVIRYMNDVKRVKSNIPILKNPYDYTEYGSTIYNNGKYWETQGNLHEYRREINRAVQMQRWASSFYGEEHGMMHSIYWPEYENEEGMVVNHDGSEFFGSFYRNYSFIATKYGARISQSGDMVKAFCKLGNIALKEDINTYVNILHLCMECIEFIENEDGVILVFRDFICGFQSIPCDFINSNDAKGLKGRICAIEVVANGITGTFEILWIRRLIFDRNGIIDTLKEHVDFDIYSNPNVEDYDCEYGMRINNDRTQSYVTKRMIFKSVDNLCL